MMTSRQHTVVAVLLAIVGAYMVRIGATEIQPTQEGAIAARAEAVAEHGEWTDQSGHAPDGLSVAAKPPLSVWMAALGLRVMGKSPIAVRWFSLLSAAVALVGTYLVARKLFPFEDALLATVITGASLPIVLYSRLGNDAMPFTAGMMTALWCVGVFAAPSRLLRIAVLVLLGVVCTACTLLMPFHAVVLVILLCTITPAGLLRVHVAVMCVASVSVAAFWYGSMLHAYGEQFLLAYSVGHGAEGSFGPLDMIGRVLESSPLAILAIVWCSIAVTPHGKRLRESQPLVVVVALWFVSITIAHSLFTDRTISNAVVLVPAVALLAIDVLRSVRALPRPSVLVSLYACLIVGGAWYAVTVLATFVTVDAGIRWIALLIAIFVAAAVALRARASARFAKTAASRGYSRFVYGSVAVASAASLLIIVTGWPQRIEGGRATAAALAADTAAVRTFVYVYHQSESQLPTNTQLGWYTNGWVYSWRTGFRYSSLAMPSNVYDPSVMEFARGASWVVYYHPHNRKMGVAANASMRDEYDVEVATRDYTVFRNR